MPETYHIVCVWLRLICVMLIVVVLIVEFIWIRVIAVVCSCHFVFYSHKTREKKYEHKSRYNWWAQCTRKKKKLWIFIIDTLLLTSESFLTQNALKHSFIYYFSKRLSCHCNNAYTFWAYVCVCVCALCTSSSIGSKSKHSVLAHDLYKANNSRLFVFASFALSIHTIPFLSLLILRHTHISLFDNDIVLVRVRFSNTYTWEWKMMQLPMQTPKRAKNIFLIFIFFSFR